MMKIKLVNNKQTLDYRLKSSTTWKHDDCLIHSIVIVYRNIGPKMAKRGTTL